MSSIEVIESNEFDDENPPTFAELMDYYKQNRDSYIQALQEFWKLPIQRRFENAAEKNTNVVEAVEALMSFAKIDEDKNPM